MILQLKDSIEKIVPKAIQFNMADIEKELLENLSKYENVVYTETQLSAEAKKDRATLNHFIELLDNERKRIADLYKRPLVEFELQIKRIISLVNEVKNKIDIQIKEFETKNKEEKRLNIQNYYDAVVGDLASILPFEKVIKAEWLNKTYSIKNIELEILEIIKKTRTDYKIISELTNCDVERLKAEYLDTLDISAVLALKEKLETLKKQVKEYDEKKETVKPKSENTMVVRLIVEGSYEQFIKLKQFLDINNFKYHKEIV